ncbi:MAG: hypothetical protein ABI874_13750 [Chloroflexota bacterium]
MVFDHQFVFFLIRWAHVTSMALMLGGALLLWGLSVKARGLAVADQNRMLLFVAERNELFFWIALGVIVMTGVGNLGAFGNALPTNQTAWGQKFAIKLGFVLVFILLSLVRTLLVARLGTADGEMGSLAGIFQSMYVGTSFFAITILFLAMALAHG